MVAGQTSPPPPAPPGNSKPWASRVAGWGPAQRRPLCSLTGLPTGFWGRQREPVSVPALLPAEAAGMPGGLAQPGPAGAPLAPYLVFAWARGIVGDSLAVVPAGMCLEPENHQKDPWGN